MLFVYTSFITIKQVQHNAVITRALSETAVVSISHKEMGTSAMNMKTCVYVCSCKINQMEK